MTAEMRAAGQDLHDALEDDKAERLLVGADNQGRFEWGYSPPRTSLGLDLASFDPDQRRLLHRLLATGLSAPGYSAAVVTMALDDILYLESGGSVVERNPLGYYLAFFGRPDDDTWSWRFQGHHLSINHTLKPDGATTGSPLFLGVNPQSIEANGRRGFQLLVEERLDAIALLDSLDAKQSAKAILDDHAPLDIVTRNLPVLGEDPFRHPDPSFLLPPEERLEVLDPATRLFVEDLFGPVAPMPEGHTDAVAFTWEAKGLPAAQLSDSQRGQLWGLIEGYAARWPSEIKESQLARIDSELEEVHFAWAGDPRGNNPYYYRIQGPSFLVEYDTPLRDPRHVHTVWRDPTGDFGGDLLAQHLGASR